MKRLVILYAVGLLLAVVVAFAMGLLIGFTASFKCPEPVVAESQPPQAIVVEPQYDGRHASPPTLLVTGRYVREYAENPNCEGVTIIVDERQPTEFRADVELFYGADEYLISRNGSPLAQGKVGLLWNPDNIIKKICTKVKEYNDER